MSKDQTPARMRVVSGDSAENRRRLADIANDGVAANAAGPESTLPDVSNRAEKAGKSMAILAVLFIAGCAIGGAALPLLGFL